MSDLSMRAIAIDDLSYRDIMDVEYVLRKSALSTVFHTVEWNRAINSISNNKTYVIIAYYLNSPMGTYIFNTENDLVFFKNFISTLMETPYGSPITIGNSHFFTKLLISQVEKSFLGRIFYITPPPDWNTKIIEEVGYRCTSVQRVSYLKLFQNSEELFAHFASKRRADIRIGLRSGIEVMRVGTEYLETYYSLHEKTCRRIGIAPKSKQIFKAVLQELEPKNMANLYLARHGDKILAGIITLSWKDRSYYWNSATSGENRELQSTSLLLWVSMQEAIKRGHKVYDLLGMDIPPVANYKKAFNGEIKKFNRYVKKSYFPFFLKK